MIAEAVPASELEIIDPHWMTALIRDDGAVIVRRSVKLTDGETDEWYPELATALVGRELLSSNTVDASEMYGGKAVVWVYEPA